MTLRSLAFCIGVLAAIAPLCVSAKCVSGQQPDYDDISAVLFERNGCGPYIHDPADCACPSYWMYVTKWGSRDWGTPQREIRQYSQFTVPGQIGTYTFDVRFKDLEAILEKHRFFDLSPPYRIMSDQTDTVLTVKRCAVVTRLMIYGKGPDMDTETASLFADLDAFVEKTPKTRTSDKPERFNMGGWL